MGQNCEAACGDNQIKREYYQHVIYVTCITSIMQIFMMFSFKHITNFK